MVELVYLREVEVDMVVREVMEMNMDAVVEEGMEVMAEMVVAIMEVEEVVTAMEHLIIHLLHLVEEDLMDIMVLMVFA